MSCLRLQRLHPNKLIAFLRVTTDGWNQHILHKVNESMLAHDGNE